MTSTSNFELYRYQLLPINRHIQVDLLNGIMSIDELLLKKNDILSDVLMAVDHFSSSKKATVTKRLFAKDNFFLFRIAVNRSLHRETKDFKEESIDNWPSVLIAIWNDPEKQMIAVQKRTTAFGRTESVVNIVLETLRFSLANFHLRAIHEPIVEKQVFLDIIKEYEGRVQKIEFEFITPNMANISVSLPENLKSFAKATNSVKNKLDIESDSESSLHIKRENTTVKALSDYVSDGGGNTAIKINGISKKINTSKTVKHLEVSEIELKGTVEEVSSLIRELMK